MGKKKPKVPRISLQVSPEDHEEWLETSQKIRGKLLPLRGIVGRFLLDKLNEAGRDGFKELKKYI